MAKFPPNLDDGELWLPSDIFLSEIPSKQNRFEIPFMEGLAGQFPAISVLQNQPPKPAFFSQRLKPAILDRSASHFLPEDRRKMYGCEDGSSLVLYDPVPGIHIRCLERRPRGLQRQQKNPNQNRVYPFQAAGFGFPGDGVVQECNGTGVFHPRIMNPTIAGREIGRKQCFRIRQGESHEICQSRSKEARGMLLPSSS